jgi:hypothetical protein
MSGGQKLARAMRGHVRPSNATSIKIVAAWKGDTFKETGLHFAALRWVQNVPAPRLCSRLERMSFAGLAISVHAGR